MQEGKAKLAAHPATQAHLVALLQPGCGEQLQCGVLRLLHNMSFDAALRQQMMAAGLVQQVCPHTVTVAVAGTQLHPQVACLQAHGVSDQHAVVTGILHAECPALLQLIHWLLSGFRAPPEPYDSSRNINN